MPTLLFENRSRNATTACLYQTIPSPPPGATSVAWLTGLTQVEGFWRIGWDSALNFLWTEDRQLPDGGTSTTGQILRGDVRAGSSVPLTTSGGSLVFGALGRDAAPGTLLIDQDALVPRTARAGIGMNGSATVLAPTQPNLAFVFRAESQIWLTVGNYRRGAVIQPAALRSVQELVFGPNVDGLYVELGDDNTLTTPVAMPMAAAAVQRYAMRGEVLSINSHFRP